MTYPPAPWQLQGYAIQSLNFLDIEYSRKYIPPELEIVSLFPGKTLGGVYLSVYESGSLVQYNELIVVAGLVKYQQKLGFWISHIYVDSETSVVGGREIWGLPKEMAEFIWQDKGVDVRQGDRLLCSLEYKPSCLNLSTWWQQKFSTSAFSGLDFDLLRFTSEFSTKLGLLSSKLTVPADSPFTELNLGQPWLTLNLKNLDLVAGIPEIVGNKSTPLEV
jgi:hypothetical protein